MEQQTTPKDETTLRDIYAGMAMQSLLQVSTTLHIDNDGARHLHLQLATETAKTAFNVADAMLAERNKDKP